MLKDLHNPPCTESNVRVTSVPLKPLCFRRVERLVCVNLSKPACIQLQFPVCAVLSLDCTQRTLYAAE